MTEGYAATLGIRSGNVLDHSVNHFGAAYSEKNISPREDEREKCNAERYDPANPGNAKDRRSNLGTTESFGNATIVRRVMTLPAEGAIEEFIMKETGEDGNSIAIVWQLPETVSKKKSWYDVNTSLYYDFKEARSFSATRLKGCTMMAIISRRGIFIGHWWENLSFDPDDDLLKGTTTEEIFEKSVLKGIRDGITEPGRASQMSLTRFAAELGDEHVRAFLIRPHESFEKNPDGYPAQWELMRQEVVRILPKIGEDNRWQTVIYNRVPQARMLGNSAAGRVLFKIDPEHVPSQTRRGKATRLAVLWLEDREIFRDEWQE